VIPRDAVVADPLHANRWPAVTSCPRHVQRIRETFRAMASQHAIEVCHDDAGRARAAIRAAIDDVLRIEAKYSRYRDDSVTSAINRGAGGTPVAIDAETAALLRYADQCHALSGGAFDITSGVLRRAWDFRAAVPRVPTQEVLDDLVAKVGWRDVEWSERDVRLPRAGMEIDFGGIGKEYAADRAAMICREHGVAHGLVNLGGDIRAIGSQPGGAPWRVGVQHPREPGATIAGFDLVDAALATSGDYERFVEIDGTRYCHLLDPRTGMPVTHWQSVSVVAPVCLVAGSCATIAMLLGRAAPAFLAGQSVRWLGVTASGDLVAPAAHA